MKNNNFVVFGIVALAIVSLILLYPGEQSNGELDAFAQCLAEREITMYGAEWCSHCQNEKKAFGDSFRLVPYVECPDDPQACIALGIKGYPTWVFPDGKKLEGEQGLEKLSEESGCALSNDQKEDILLPPADPQGVVLPVRWGDLGVRLVDSGIIDREKFDAVYASRGGISEADRRFLEETDNGNIKITPENAGFLLNLFWAFGLAQKNEILDDGPMRDPQYGGADRFASTGGWTLSNGNAMEHYSRHSFVVLTPLQQQMVERVSKNIYRPCCGNSTHFPDCNHGMAMLGLLELMASQGVSEKELYRVALQVNTYWFSDTYLTIERYLAMNGMNWRDADPKELLGADYSSGSGYQRILSRMPVRNEESDGSCGV